MQQKIEEKRNVRRIEVYPAKAEVGKQTVRVAAYCRVSTDKNAQQSSLNNQIDLFHKKIAQHAGWELVKIYTDRGISGTNAGKRTGFMEMIGDCEKGRIDVVITKSISRFARNTLDCIGYVRKLNGMGVHVIFEEENLDTSSAFSEMMLTILAAFAQEESISISSNMIWSYRKRYAQGECRWTFLYGYRKQEDGTIVVEEEEARVVAAVFDWFVHGMSKREICERLNEKGLSSPGGKAWRPAHVLALLNNERYTGDVMLQKYVVVDHLSHKRVKNSGQAPQYLVEGQHPAIVSRQVYAWARRINELRDTRSGSPQYPYDKRLRCPCCGQQLIHGATYDKSKGAGWMCFGEKGCRQYVLLDKYIDAAVLEACGQKRLRDTLIEEEMISVEYYWLDKYVERICIGSTQAQREDYRTVRYFAEVTVTWKDDTATKGTVHFTKRTTPERCAATYQAMLERISAGERRAAHSNMVGLGPLTAKGAQEKKEEAQS